jgi:hypothetical protein
VIGINRRRGSTVADGDATIGDGERNVLTA